MAFNLSLQSNVFRMVICGVDIGVKIKGDNSTLCRDKNNPLLYTSEKLFQRLILGYLLIQWNHYLILKTRREGIFIYRRVNGFILKYISFYILVIHADGENSSEIESKYVFSDMNLEITLEEIEVREGMF